MAELDGRVAIVTGAARGIGAAIARAFDDRGASVAICDVAGNPEQVASGLRNSIGVVCDVSSEDDVDALIKRTLGEFGRLDIVVNNAGIDGAFNPLAESAPDTFDQVIAVNLRGVYLVMRKSIPALISSGGGSVINIASVAAVVAFAGTSAYTASKAGVVGLTRLAAHEYGSSGVRVNAILPGVIETPMLADLKETAPEMYEQVRAQAVAMTSQARLGQPDEIASVAAFLAGDGASFLTGAAIPVDGGYTVA
ncbi:SDR family NAD(P)-dependent oxidoreductase [Mycobacterium sp.]|jgi:NAD(P)-dependent dehydrogenase (short-subunit alcohol dehydrogenase family)|uniref:SDR family NAD(P)-dependent oxidoreductase n=1 Tax=Mycobacterium sp. TaxID=1785 RepID=UPI002CE67C43|nr:SDR family NAD(P)-dependent oxidoreductase [Mycobacterium sp.]HXB90320.1 SDR family NAD(P)-dependent oxidoreductase [Mycobacterium sp.]